MITPGYVVRRGGIVDLNQLTFTPMERAGSAHIHTSQMVTIPWWFEGFSANIQIILNRNILDGCYGVTCVNGSRPGHLEGDLHLVKVVDIGTIGTGGAAGEYPYIGRWLRWDRAVRAWEWTSNYIDESPQANEYLAPLRERGVFAAKPYPQVTR